MEITGATIDYHRFDGNLKETHHPKRSDGVTEWITSSGPLFEPIHLMVRQRGLGWAGHSLTQIFYFLY
jgi:hypothetical protein